jgi:hypothetical protein
MFLSAFQITIHQLCFKILFKALQDPKSTAHIGDLQCSGRNHPVLTAHHVGHDAGAPTYTYRVDEDVYAAGSGFATGTNVDIRVIPDQDWNDGDPIPPDVTGAVETVSVVNGDVGPVLVWNAPLVPGKYDIVIDHEPKTASTTQQQTGWTADRPALSWLLTHRRRHHHHQYRFQYSSRPESSLWLACCVLLA